MKKPNFLSRFLALGLILSLTLPNPAFALRQTGVESDDTKQQLTVALAGAEGSMSRRQWVWSAAGSLLGMGVGGFAGDALMDVVAAGTADSLPGKLVNEPPKRRFVAEIAQKLGVIVKPRENDDLESHVEIGRVRQIPGPDNDAAQDNWERIVQHFHLPAGTAHATFWVPLRLSEEGGELTTEDYDLLSFVTTYEPNLSRFRLSVDTEKPIREPGVGVFDGIPGDLFLQGPNPHIARRFHIPLVPNIQRNYGTIRGLRVELWARDPTTHANFSVQLVRAWRTREYIDAQDRRKGYRIAGTVGGAVAGWVAGFLIGRRISKRGSRSTTDPAKTQDRPPAAGAEESVTGTVSLKDSYSGMVFKVPPGGIIVDGYTTEDGRLVPKQLMESELLVPAQPRLLVPTAQMGTGLRLHVQQGLLDEELVAALRFQGVEVKVSW